MLLFKSPVSLLANNESGGKLMLAYMLSLPFAGVVMKMLYSQQGILNLLKSVAFCWHFNGCNEGRNMISLSESMRDIISYWSFLTIQLLTGFTLLIQIDSFVYDIQNTHFLRNLKIEYEQLKAQHLGRGLSPPSSPPDSLASLQHTSEDAELIAEAKLLRQHKGRLEARMQILEDHNKQLESQLQRLRQLLEQVPNNIFFIHWLLWLCLYTSEYTHQVIHNESINYKYILNTPIFRCWFCREKLPYFLCDVFASKDNFIRIDTRSQIQSTKTCQYIDNQ